MSSYKQVKKSFSASIDENVNYQIGLLEKAISKYSPFNDFNTEESTGLKINDLTFILQDTGHLMQPKALEPFAKLLENRLNKKFENDVYPLYTILSGKFNFGLSNLNLYLQKDKINEMKDYFQGLLEGVNYIGNIEFAIFANSRINTDPLVSVHVHFTSWDNKEKLEVLREKCQKEIGNKGQYTIPFKVSWHDNLLSVCEYIFKSPFAAKSVKPNGTIGCDVRYSQKTLYSILKSFQKKPIYRFAISGGEGVKIFNKVRELERKKFKK